MTGARSAINGVCVALALSLSACGGSKKKPVAAPAANAVVPAAAAKMISGVEFAKTPSGRDRAAALMREAIAIDPKLWEAHYNLGVLLAQSGDLAEAEPSLEHAAQLAPGAEEIAMALGQVRRRRGENRKAADGLQLFVEQHPEAKEARALYVVALRDSGQIDAAIAQARDALRRKAGDATALAELALSELAKGERDSAELLVKEAIASNKESAIAHRTAGLVALAKGDDAAAFASFVKASHLDPKDTTSRLNIGTVLVRAGVYGKAEEQFRAVLKDVKDDPDASIGLAAALRAQGDKDHTAKWNEAQKILEGVLARDPHNVGAEFNLAILLADFMKKPAEAKPLFQRFLVDAPADHPARAEADRQAKAIGAK
ncbi:MAG TPA: tetratricopeptide repeat protein [Polyangiaceae bacterium]|nr:tetratricopeptide repeat protein [Polyangiaceae bacterium]